MRQRFPNVVPSAQFLDKTFKWSITHLAADPNKNETPKVVLASSGAIVPKDDPLQYYQDPNWDPDGCYMLQANIQDRHPSGYEETGPIQLSFHGGASNSIDDVFIKYQVESSYTLGSHRMVTLSTLAMFVRQSKFTNHTSPYYKYFWSLKIG